MRAVIRSIIVGLWVLAVGVGAVQAAEQAKQAKAAQPAATAQPPMTAQPAMDPAKQAAMEAMQRLGSPSEGHKAFEPFVGTWSYTAQWWMVPDGPAQTITGTATNSLIYGGRFLKQEIRGTTEGQPPFEGIGLAGYDNIREEYQTVWLDNMATGMMLGTGAFDADTATLVDEGDFSCPMTGEAHRAFRTTWKVVDPNHTTYENYMSAADGREFKAMEIRYTRAP